MIEFIFTLDYEIYGNGEGSLRELVYEPAEKLAALFRKWDARFVLFVEAAELEIIEAHGTDPAIQLVKQQVRELFQDGFEIGLHLHPQWYNAQREDGRWLLDYNEYNLCTLPKERIAAIVDRSISYLRDLVGVADFTPFSFRAGNWLFQPTRNAADVLATRGIKVDSSVFKGGLQHRYKLDYRPALRNGAYWRFTDHVELPDPDGVMLELPIHTQMVPPWKMLTTKRVGLQRKGSAGMQTAVSKLYRFADLLRLRQPLKLDFCRMTVDELTHMMARVFKDHQQDDQGCRPVVAIGHTKDLLDLDPLEYLIYYLRQKGILITTLEGVYPKCEF